MWAELYLSDSDFNGRDLIAVGAPAAKCHTVPPFHRIGRLDALPLDETLPLSCEDGKTSCSSVGCRPTRAIFISYALWRTTSTACTDVPS